MGVFGNRYTVERCDGETIRKMVKENHYLHSVPPITNAWVLVDNEQERTDTLPFFDLKKPVGVVTYGPSFSPAVAHSLLGEKSKMDQILELNRLWIHDDVPRNAASYLVGNTLSGTARPLIISYADTGEGHIGYVYQATNWWYAGTSEDRMSWKIPDEGDTRSITEKMSYDEVREKYGDRAEKIERSKKHRYVYFACDARTERSLKEQCQWDLTRDYPKGD